MEPVLQYASSDRTGRRGTRARLTKPVSFHVQLGMLLQELLRGCIVYVAVQFRLSRIGAARAPLFMTVLLCAAMGCRAGATASPRLPQNATLAATDQATADPITSPSPTDTPRGTNDGITEQRAIALANAEIPAQGDPELWATDHGPFADVFDALANRPDNADQPLPDSTTPDHQVWGIAFAVTVQICGPQGVDCEDRRAIRTVFLDYADGTWITTATYSPSPDEPFPTPPQGLS